MSSSLFDRHGTLGKRVFMFPLRRGFSRGFAVVALGAAACENAENPLVPKSLERPPIHQYVTGEAADALLRNGELRLAPGESPDGTPIITADRAIELANAYVRTYGYSFKPMWERHRGGRIDLATITAAPRVYFVRTPYGPFPEGFHPALKRWYGPWYHVTLTSGGSPVILMAVSAYLSDYRVGKTGLLVLPRLSGNDFVHMGVSMKSNRFAPIGPEEAVARVAQASGARIDRTPELVLRGAFSSPLFAAWQLTLDRPVSLSAPPNGRDTRVVFAGPMGHRNFLVAAPNQPAFEDRDVGRRVGSRGERLTLEHFQVPVRSGRVVKFEDALLTGAGGLP